MTTDQTDHRAEAERWTTNLPQAPDVAIIPLHAGDRASIASAHLLAALHDGQQEQTALLRALVEQATPKGDPCPCGRRRDVEAKPHVHFWKPQQNVTSRGHAMDPIEVCECGTARRATDPEPESVTVTLPRDVVEVTSAVGWRANADMLRMRNFRVSAALLDALADALDAANGSQS